MKSMNVNIINQTSQSINTTPINQVYQAATKTLHLEDYTINIVLVTNETIQHLNESFRNKNQPTDVLTFPDGTLKNLGDVFISIDKVISQSKEYQHSVDRELAFLALHGLLHTLGYDHQTKEQETEMFSLQETLLQKSNITR